MAALALALLAGWLVLGVVAICACVAGGRAEAGQQENAREDKVGERKSKPSARAAVF